MNHVLKIVLFIVAIVLVYLIYRSIEKYPESDKEIRTIYRDAIEQFMDIRDAQVLYENEFDSFAPNFRVLNNYVRTAYVNLPDSLQIDSISVRDSIFGKREIPKLGELKTEFGIVPLHMETGFLENRSDSTQKGKAVFAAWAHKTELLNGFDQEIIDRDRLNKQTNKILEDSIIVGSLEKQDTKGNWSNSYEIEVAKKQGKPVKKN